MIRNRSKYLLISQRIIRMIREGRLGIGQRVPSESEIIDRYGVSNTTARRALAEIEHAGWVERIKGRGTFVRRREVGRSVDRILSFTRNMIDAGRNPSTRVLGVVRQPAGRSVRVGGRTYMLAGPVCRLTRLRLADGVPMMHEVRWISLALCPDIDRQPLGESLYELYRRMYGLELTQIKQSLAVARLETVGMKTLFDLDRPCPAFLVEGATFVAKETLLEIERSFYRGDLYRFSITASGAGPGGPPAEGGA